MKSGVAPHTDVFPLTTSGESSARAAGAAIAGFVIVALQFALIALLVTRFNLESAMFQDVVRIALAGFVIHHFLPSAWRLRFFLLLSVVAILHVLGMDQRQWHLGLALSRGVPLFAIGLALIAICHLPVRVGVRIALLVGAGGLLAWLRSLGNSAYFDAGLLTPIVASMFMFRLIIYLYDLQHEKTPQPFVRVLSYFFLLPNVCFTLFPVIDYKAFSRNYYNEPALQIYQRGLGWMLRGIVHLLLWRIIYYQCYIDPTQVASGGDIVRYIATNVGLYLHVSGQFHLAVGLLLLFGFNLPETNHRFYIFAASFADLWRRLNIYWMNFMMRIFYYPAVFRLKALGPARSVVVSTIFVFVVTWLLHSYQTFWIRGSFPITIQDAIFWGCQCALVIATFLHEMKKGRKRTLGATVLSWPERLNVGWHTTITVFILCMLWSLWACDSVEQWIGMWKFADASALVWGAVALAAVFIVTVAVESSLRTPAAAVAREQSRLPTGQTLPALLPRRRTLQTCAVPAMLLLVLSVRSWHGYLGPDASDIVASLFQTKLNRSDEQSMVRGYYENLMDVPRANPMLDVANSSRPSTWDSLEKSAAYRRVDDYRMYELVPSTRVVLNGKELTTNRWGMRDQDYAVAKPPDTYRLALLGSSVAMGMNVGDTESFERLIEERLNHERAGRPYARYEILNFGVNGYNPPAQVLVLEKKVRGFKPDAVVLLAHPQDSYYTVERFVMSLRRHIEAPSEVFDRVAREAKVDARTTELTAERRLAPYWRQLVEWAYEGIAERCRQEGIRAVFVYLPGASSSAYDKDGAEMRELARKAGFTVIDLENAYGGSPPESVEVAPWDSHPNALGHQMIARALYPALIAATIDVSRESSAARGPALARREEEPHR
jgi:hypothetical protein